MRQEISSKTHVAVACLVLFVTSLFLTAYSARNPTIARVGSTLVLKVTAPALQISEFVRSGLMTGWGGYVNLVSTAEENRELKKQLGEYESRIALLSEAERENRRLRELLTFSSQNQVRGITAAVIGGDPSGWIKGIVIDKGREHGVGPGMAVIHSQGVVGQVISTAATSSKVLLVSDHASGVDVLMHNSRARGVVEGAGEKVCELKFVTKDVQVRVGEQVLTSGMDGVYPKGIAVGQVAEVGGSAAGLFQPIEVKPSVDFSRLEEVLVIPSPASALGTAVLNYPAHRVKGGE